MPNEIARSTAESFAGGMFEAASPPRPAARHVARSSAATGRARLRRAWKAVVDPAAALLLILLLAPLFLAIALVVWRTSGRPILFGHERWGEGGRRFVCYKFRTMEVDAEARLQEILKTSPEARAQWRRHAKLKSDPRVTRIGWLLRRTSLDELPQLWNVLVGDMSLVGARPIAIGEERLWGKHFARYLDAKPGLTGPWQVSYRNSADYRRRMVLHRHYVARWTPLADIRTLALTLAVPFRRENAY